MITELELGWLAGILEGEGYFGFNSNGNAPTFSVSMVDEDVVNRIASTCSKLTGRQHNIYYIDRFTKINPKWQEQYKIQLNGPDARVVLVAVVRFMGHRRRQRIWQVLNGYRAPKTKVDISAIMTNVIKFGTK